MKRVNKSTIEAHKRKMKAKLDAARAIAKKYFGVSNGNYFGVKRKRKK